MAIVNGYPVKAFSENQTFLVYDPSTSTTARVRGSDLIDYITPNLNVVRTESTTDGAANEDYKIGSVIQTTGQSAPGDGQAGLFLVVPAGDGDLSMLNGNDLLTIAGDAFLRTQLNDGIVRFDSLSEMESTAGRFDADAGRLVSGTGQDGDFRWNASDLSGTLILSSITSTSVDSGTDTITSAGHGLVDGDGVVAQTAVNGLSLNTVYWVINATTNTFQLSATFGGPAFDLTGTVNFTVDELLDPRKGRYVTSATDLTGTGGAWIREVRDSVYIEHFGAETGNDVTAEAQAALNLAMKQNLAVKAGAGSFAISKTLNAIQESSDTDVSSGLILTGAGMGKTRFINGVSNGAMIYVQSTDPYFAKGGEYADFSIIGDGAATSSDGIRTKGAWWTTCKRVRIVKLNGVAFIAGDDDAVNPDTTANLGVSFEACELDENEAGFYNAVNNNAPFIQFINCGIRNNANFGIKANSSYIMIRGGSVSFNGITGGVSSEGGIIINETTGTTFSTGYRSKGVKIDNVEIDTNYPVNGNFVTCENLKVTGCSTQFRDYSAIDWAGNSITEFPEAQFIFGGSTSTERAIGTIFEDSKISIHLDGNLTLSGTGHTVFLDKAPSQGTRIRELMYNLVIGGTTPGTDWFIFKEEDKSPYGRNSREFYADFEYPRNNFQYEADFPDAFDFQIQRVLPSYQNLRGESQHYAFSVADDSVKSIKVPQSFVSGITGEGYNMLAVTANGQAANSGIVLIRATTGPAASVITNGSTNLATTTGVLTGTTGVDGNLTVSPDTDGTVYIENRLGATFNVHVSWLLMPGLKNQV